MPGKLASPNIIYSDGDTADPLEVVRGALAKNWHPGPWISDVSLVLARTGHIAFNDPPADFQTAGTPHHRESG